jgi:hypothetical protein
VSTSQLKKTLHTISDTFGNQGTKRKNDNQLKMEANKSTSVKKKAKSNEKATKSASGKVSNRPRDTGEPESAEANKTGKMSNGVNVTAIKKTIHTISETFGNQGTKRKNDNLVEMEADKSTSVPVKKAKINEKTATSAPSKASKGSRKRANPTDDEDTTLNNPETPVPPPKKKRAPAATPSKASKGSKKRANPSDDEDTTPDDPKTPVPPPKKKRGNTSKAQPIRRTGMLFDLKCQ